MGDFVLGLAKSVVDGALTKAQSAIEEEEKLRQSVQSDLVFITAEFQMMQSFLNATNEERVRNNVVRTWVSQVRDLAYDVEDCIEFVVNLDNKPSWWFHMLPSCMAPALPLDEAVAEIKKLKARVEDVSHRNARYKLITDSGSKPVAVGQQQPMATAGTAAFDIVQEARDTARKHRGLVDLTELIANKDDPGLQVISLWGTGGDLGMASIIKKAYDDQHVRQAFGCRGWVKVSRWAKLTRPFNVHEFLRSLVTQFSASSGQEQGATAGVDALTRMEAAAQDELVKDFVKQVEEKRYLVVLEDLSTVSEWETIRMYLPDKKNGSRIVVSTQQLDIATMCTPQPCGLSELMQLSADHSVCVFYQGRRDGGITKEIIDQVKASDDFNNLMSKLATAGSAAFDIVQEARDTARKHRGLVDLTELITNKDDPGLQVISLWGTGGDLGTASIIKKAYDDQHVRQAFGCRGWVKVSRWAKLNRPFNLHEFLRSLVTQFSASSGQEQGATAGVDALTRMEAAAQDELVKDFVKQVEEKRYLVVLEDLSTVSEWETIRKYLPDKKNGSRIVVSTQQMEIASLCTPQPCGLSELMQLSADHSVCVFYSKEGLEMTLLPLANFSHAWRDNAGTRRDTEET